MKIRNLMAAVVALGLAFPMAACGPEEDTFEEAPAAEEEIFEDETLGEDEGVLGEDEGLYEPEEPLDEEPLNDDEVIE